MSLWLCLRFEQLPLQSLNRSEEQPIVILAKQRVLRTNDCAAELGIRQGMSGATVRALAGDQSILLLERDTTSEQRCLQQLCCWAYSITPSLHTWREDCLQLEIGGCLALSGGLDPLLAEVAGALGSRGYHVRRGLAATPKAAWLLSFADRDTALDIPRPLPERLADLPLKLLDEFADTVDSLRRAGLHTLGDILALPAAALGRRCGRAFTDFLQQALGRREDPQADYRPPATFNDEYWFGYEVKANEELLPAAQLLLQSLCRFLRNTQLQTGEITWQLIGIDHRIEEVCIRSAGSRSDWKNWYQLTVSGSSGCNWPAAWKAWASPASSCGQEKWRISTCSAPAARVNPWLHCWTGCAAAWGYRPSNRSAVGMNTCRNMPCTSVSTMSPATRERQTAPSAPSG